MIVQHAEVNIARRGRDGGWAHSTGDQSRGHAVAGGLSAEEIASRREELVTRAQSGKLCPADISGGVFTICNLWTYSVDALNAIVNPPQRRSWRSDGSRIA
jgi:pyruvate/2-oxoglutarate dehydrogenase complex dihydrolipoamide acyltransferase (E2) component